MVKVAVLASGSGTNFQNIVEALSDGRGEGYKVEVLICDKEGAYALKRAHSLEIPGIFINPREFSTKKEYEEKIIETLKKYEIELVALAGYMRIVSETFLGQYEGKIINIHPAYLPEFPGKDGIGDAYRAGAARTGVTVHYVDSGVDTGKIIDQVRLDIDKNWTLEELEEKIHELEYQLYPQVLTKISEEIKEREEER